MHARRLPFSFDVHPLAAEVEAFDPDDWIAHFVPQNYRGDWSVIPLRGPAGETHPVRMIHSDPTCTDFVDTPFLARAPALREVVATFEADVHAVRLMRLGPGSQILPHRDHDLELDLGRARLHVPIVTNPDVEFRLAGRRVDMRPGECWYLRLADEHEVTNGGATARIHLVLDVVANDWLRARLDEGPVSEPG